MVKAKAIVLLAISGVLFVLAVLVVVMNLGNRFAVHLFTTRVENVRIGAGLAYAAITGGILWAIWRACVPRGWRLWKQAQRADEERLRRERVDRLVAEDEAHGAPESQTHTPPNADKTEDR